MLKTRKKLFLMILISNIILITGTIVAYAALYTDASNPSCSDTGGFPTALWTSCSYIWSSGSGDGMINWRFYTNLYHDGNPCYAPANSGNASSPYYDSRTIAGYTYNVSGVAVGHFTNSSYFSTTSQLNPPFGSVSDSAYNYCYRSGD